MASRKKNGRAAAEAAYADLLKENTTLVGDVGEAYDAYTRLLADTAVARERYEDARAAAVKGGAVTNDQLEHMGYKKTPKLPSLAERTSALTADGSANPSTQAANGAAPASSALVSASINTERSGHE